MKKKRHIVKVSDNNDWIYLRGLRLECRIGVAAKERRKAQIITANIELKYPLRRAGLSDRLKDTIDYAALAAKICNLARKKTFCLLEALAEQIAVACLAEEKIREVAVHLTKTRPVPYLDASEVEIRRRRGRLIK